MKEIRELVFDQLESLVNDKACFTAFDVTNSLRKNMNVRHSHVRDVVETLYNSTLVWGGYTRTPIEVQLQTGEMREAYLYHPVEFLQKDLDKHYVPSQRGLFDPVDMESDKLDQDPDPYKDEAHNGAFDFSKFDTLLSNQTEPPKLEPKKSLGSRVLSLFKSRFFK